VKLLHYSKKSLNVGGRSKSLKEVVVKWVTERLKERCYWSSNSFDYQRLKGPVTSADQMIQGKVAGLQITNGGGSPGEGATIRTV
jgi:iron complex outermembrane receptor protein